MKAFIQAQARLLQRVGVRAESRFLDVPAVSGLTHVLVSGAGPPVVLVPGLSDPAAMWAPLMARLPGFTLYAVDRPCFGLTGCAPHRTTTVRALAVDFLRQVLDALGLDRPAFVGNSMGSLWSLWLALARPDRVAAMTHIGCPAFILGTSAPLPLRLLSVPLASRLLMRAAPPSEKQVDAFAATVGADLSRLPELRELLVEAQRLPGAQAALRVLLHAVLTPRGPRPDVVLTPSHLSRITQPVQLIWGEDDPFGGPEVAVRVARLVPDCELELIRDAGHVPWIDHPGPVGAWTAAFLRERTPPEPRPAESKVDGSWQPRA